MLIKLTSKGKMKKIKTEDEIEKKQVIKDIEKKISNRVFANLIIAVIIMTYFCILSVIYKETGYNTTINIVKWATLVFLAIAIILMEIAYKKESKIWAINALEILALAVHSLTTTHITKIYNFDFPKYVLWSSYAFSIYYVLKTIIINTKARKDYLRSLSDISQIVQKDEPQKKEATKKEKKVVEEEKIEKVKEHKIFAKMKNKEKNKEEKKEIKEETTVEVEIKEKEKVNKEEKTEKSENEDVTENKRTTRNKKLAGLLEKLDKMNEETSKETKKQEPKEEQPKEEAKIEIEEKNEVVEEKKEIKKEAAKKTTAKKTTTKKTTTKKSTTAKSSKDNKEEKTEDISEENKPKKRGRPKKEVKVND